jgi:hypothetical protein
MTFLPDYLLLIVGGGDVIGDLKKIVGDNNLEDHVWFITKKPIEILRKYTAASNNFPLGIYVRVTNPKNNQFVIVKINDRMAVSMSKKGRIVDLTRLAAKEIGIIEQGIGKVLVQKVEKMANK